MARIVRKPRWLYNWVRNKPTLGNLAPYSPDGTDLATVSMWAEPRFKGSVTAADCGIPEDLPLVDVWRLVPDQTLSNRITQGSAEDRANVIVGLLLLDATEECLLSVLLDQRNGIAFESRDEAEAAIAAGREAYEQPIQDALAYFAEAGQQARANAGFALCPDALTHLDTLRQRRPNEFERIRGRLRVAGASLRALDTALKKHRQTKVRTAAATGQSVRRPPDAGPYGSDRSGTFYYKETVEGTISVQLANFHATIKKEVIRDDGTEENAFFEIEGRLCPSGKPLPVITVSLSQFNLMTWVTPNWGNAAIVNAGASIRDHLRCAIQKLSGDKVERIVVYGHTGWRRIRNAWWYLHAGGALGASGNREDIMVEVDTGAMQRYRLPVSDCSTTALQAAIRCSLAIIDIAPERRGIGYLCLATIYRAPTYSAYRIDLVTFIEGKTGAMKTELLALLIAHFGDFSARDLPASWEDTATDVEIKASHAQDAVFAIDDFKPTGGRNGVDKMHAKADRILRGAGNQSGRGRRSANLGAKPAYFPRGFIVCTGEDVPRGESLRGRLVIAGMRKGDIDPERLTALQQAGARGELAVSMAGYIRWLAPQFDALRDTLPAEVQRYRQRDDLQFAHSRAKDNLGSLMAGLRLFLDYALAVGAINLQTHAAHMTEGEKTLVELLYAQAQYIRDADEVDRFLALLRTAFNTGRAHLSDQLTNGPPTDAPSFWGWRQLPARDPLGTDDNRWEPQGDRIGWLNGDELLLDAEAAFTTAQMLAQHQGQCFEITQATLWARMRDRGLLILPRVSDHDDARQKEPRLKIQRRIAGKVQRVLALKAAVLDESRTRCTRSETENQDGCEIEICREEF